MAAPRWIDDCKPLWPVTRAAQRLGLNVRVSFIPMIRPCPACGEDRRGSTDRRPPINIHHDDTAWSCKRGACGAGGDVVDLVSFSLTGRRFKDGSDSERAEVRRWFTGDDASPARPVPPPRPPALERDYPPLAEVAEFWSASRSPSDVPAVAAWLRRRFGEATALRAESNVLVRALPAHPGPSWASCGRRSWAALGYLAIIPGYDSDGRLRSTFARWTGEGAPPPGHPKCSAPTGHKRAGLVLANAAGVSLLRTGAQPTWWPRGRALDVWIVEGEPDFLAWSSRAWEFPAPAVLGLFQGGWSTALAARLPTGSEVTIATHGDVQGDRYADEVHATVKDRCSVYRRRPGSEHHV